jgi:hypothetical protein
MSPIKLLIWLDDRPRSASFEIELARSQGFKLLVFSSPYELAAWIEEYRTSGIEVSSRDKHLGFVVDIMMIGWNDLSILGIGSTSLDYGSRAGLVFVDRYLRDPALDHPFHDAPICFLTERRIDNEMNQAIERIKRRSGDHIYVAYKYDSTNNFREFLSVVERKP